VVFHQHAFVLVTPSSPRSTVANAEIIDGQNRVGRRRVQRPPLRLFLARIIPIFDQFRMLLPIFGNFMTEICGDPESRLGFGSNVLQKCNYGLASQRVLNYQTACWGHDKKGVPVIRSSETRCQLPNADVLTEHPL
jgi:hypothetical protein